MNVLKVDIIIPIKQINHYIQELIPRVLSLDYDHFGVIIFPDSLDPLAHTLALPSIRIIPTGPIGPAQKRNMALKHSNADILAFIDDDAYPRSDWLRNAVRHFGSSKVAAVGGPAVTSPDNSFFQRVSGATFLSRVGGGHPERCWPTGVKREVDDWPSVNLFVRKDIFQKIGGFSANYWPGEDTKLCLDIVKAGQKIIYDPDVFVWHHRRSGLIRHLRQTGRYGIHRGFFVKKFPETSRKLKYFFPSFFVIFLIIGTLLPFSDNILFRSLYCTGIGIYLVVLVAALYQIQDKEKNLPVALFSLLYIFLTHIWYGIRFLQGLLFTKDLKSKLRKSI